MIVVCIYMILDKLKFSSSISFLKFAIKYPKTPTSEKFRNVLEQFKGLFL